MNLTAFARERGIFPFRDKTGPTEPIFNPNVNQGCAPARKVIHEGQRNSTLSHFAGRVLKKFGTSDEKAYNLFMDEAAKCSPPLRMDELSVIWTSALGFFKKVQAEPDYIAPEEYVAQDFDELRKLDATPCKYDPLYIIVSYLPNEYAKAKDKKSCRLADFPGNSAVIVDLKPLPVEENMMLLLKHYGLTLRFNLIKQSPEVWKSAEKVGRLQDWYSKIRDFCDKQNIKIPENKLGDMLLSIACREKYNPWTDYLEECLKNYDGKDYIGKLSATLISDMPDGLKRKYIEKFLLQTAYIGTSDDGDETRSTFYVSAERQTGRRKKRMAF